MPTLTVTSENAREQQELAAMRARLLGNVSYGGCMPRRLHFCEMTNTVNASTVIPIVPRTEWVRLIKEGQGTFLHDLTKDVLPPHDQGSTNYCWAHGSVRAVEALRVYQGQTPVVLSAESVAVPVTNGRNRGGTVDEAVGQLQKFGACNQSFWPDNDFNKNHAKDGWKDDALNHSIITWADVVGWDVQISLALHRIPVAIALGWWGHLVCQLDPVILDDGTVGIGCDNSWGPDYGDNGYFLLDEKKGTADWGAFAPLSETFFPT